MRIPVAFAASIAAFATWACASAEIQFTPGADAKPYRKVLIAPAQVEFHRDFVAEMKSMRGRTQRLSADNVQKLAREMGDGFGSALAEAFRKRGFEIALAPGSDVLNISPALKDLYLNAPEDFSMGMVRSYVREAGRASMVVEGNDATGARVFVASERATTGRIGGLQPASDVSNRFWFDTMFRRWADKVAVALARAE